MEAQLKNNESIPLVRRIANDASPERRLAHLIQRLEKRLEEDAASTFTAEDLAFQLTDLKLELMEITKVRSRPDNIMAWLQLFVTSATLLTLIYLSGFIIQVGQ